MICREVVRAVRQISRGYPKYYLDCSSYRNQGAVGDVAMVSVQCAVCTGMSV